MICCNWISIN